MKADANVLETASTQYAVRDLRVIMMEPLVRILAVIVAVYNVVERVLSRCLDRQVYTRDVTRSQTFTCFSCKAVHQCLATRLLPLKRGLLESGC